MYASFARNSPAPVGADLLSLSWKGDARRGWLVTGNSRKTVGVTYTQLSDVDDEFECDLFESTAEQSEISLERQANRRNFNFREHGHEVSIVRWNKHLDKIATCDASGTVIVWRNHNGRSIMELVNNRGTAISDFQWSNDGNKVLIAYIDGYVLVGTAYGRRIWARQLNLGSFVTNPNSSSQSSSLLSSTWSPDDSRIVVGSSIGELIELDAITGGTLVSTTEVLPGIGIIGLQWVLVPKTAATNVDTPGISSAKESHSSTLARGQVPAAAVVPAVVNQQGVGGGQGGAAGGQQQQGGDGSKSSTNNVRLSLYLKNGKVVLMNSCGDQQATIIRTGLVDGRMLWSSDGAILAVAGFRKSQSMSTVRFFQPSGQLLFTLPLRTKELVTAITWAHQDQKFFVATRNLLHCVNIHRGIPSLQTLCQAAVASSLAGRENCFDLVLPTKLKVAVAESFDSVVQGHIPKRGKLLEYVTSAPPPTHRIYCTVYPNQPPRDHSNSSTTSSSGGQRSRHPTSYTLYVEHLGTLVPILEAQKRSTKIRQSFTISLPNRAGQSRNTPQPQRHVLNTSEGSSLTENRESTVTTNPSQVRLYSPEAHIALNTESGHELAYREDDGDSPRHPLINSNGTVSTAAVGSHSSGEVSSKISSENGRQLAEVTSNVMASKFKIQGVNDRVPADMGSIMIKTSFLHIQPRKVIAYLPHPEQRDSGIETDSSSDESSSEDNLSNLMSCSADVFMEPENQSIEEMLSMEEPLVSKSKSTDVEMRQVESNLERSQPNSDSGMGTGLYSVSGTASTVKQHHPSQQQPQRMSMSDSHVQIHSKTPTWNEQHMIYQLDFGGRVTTKSAKNFQLELEDEQVLQFGRIDNGCFILDFQAPFSPIQAFATALANLV